VAMMKYHRCELKLHQVVSVDYQMIVLLYSTLQIQFQRFHYDDDDDFEIDFVVVVVADMNLNIVVVVDIDQSYRLLVNLGINLNKIF
jgi:hypothetical protein